LKIAGYESNDRAKANDDETELKHTPERLISARLFPERDEQHKEKRHKKNPNHSVTDGLECEFRLHRVSHFSDGFGPLSYCHKENHRSFLLFLERQGCRSVVFASVHQGRAVISKGPPH